MDFKICTKCKKEFPATTEFFHKAREGKFGLRADCNACVKEYSRQYRQENREKMLERQQQWRERNPDYKKRWHGINFNYNKEYGKMLRGKRALKKAHKRYREKNKLSCNMSTAICESLKGNKAGRHWETLVSYTLEQLKQHLEGLFQTGMSWGNYGEWHVDHIIPRSFYGEKLENPNSEEFQECWSLANLQPLCAEENLRKHSKLDWMK